MDRKRYFRLIYQRTFRYLGAALVIALLTARKGSLYIMEEQSYALLWEGKLPENPNELGIEANPQRGVYLSLEYFDPRKNQTGYLSGEQP